MMAVNRRTFLKKSACAAGVVTLSPAASGVSRKLGSGQQKSAPHLKPITDNIVPISVAERKSRIEKARRLMKENGIDAVLLESGSSLFYFTGIRWGRSERMFGAILPARGELAYICPAFEEERARERLLFGDDVRVWQEHESPFRLAAGILKDRGAGSGKIGVEESVRFFLFDGIRKELPAAQFVSADAISAGCRMIKSPAELALMHLANEAILKAYAAAFARMREGMTQFEFNAECAAAFRAQGVQGGAGVQFGQFSAFPHGSRKPQRLKEGDIVLVDGGCAVEGYRGDITRTTVFGTPNAKQLERWRLVRQAQDAAFAAVKPGVPCEIIDATARKLINEAGFGPGYKNFFHRVGHGIGLDTHEWTYLVKGNKTPLQPGMCFSNEPGIYVYGEFGVRTEDCFYVTEDGYQTFAKQAPSLEQPIG